MNLNLDDYSRKILIMNPYPCILSANDIKRIKQEMRKAENQTKTISIEIGGHEYNIAKSRFDANNISTMYNQETMERIERMNSLQINLMNKINMRKNPMIINCFPTKFNQEIKNLTDQDTIIIHSHGTRVTNLKEYQLTNNFLRLSAKQLADMLFKFEINKESTPDIIVLACYTASKSYGKTFIDKLISHMTVKDGCKRIKIVGCDGVYYNRPAYNAPNQPIKIVYKDPNCEKNIEKTVYNIYTAISERRLTNENTPQDTAEVVSSLLMRQNVQMQQASISETDAEIRRGSTVFYTPSLDPNPISCEGFPGRLNTSSRLFEYQIPVPIFEKLRARQISAAPPHL